MAIAKGNAPRWIAALKLVRPQLTGLLVENGIDPRAAEAVLTRALERINENAADPAEAWLVETRRAVAEWSTARRLAGTFAVDRTPAAAAGLPLFVVSPVHRALSREAKGKKKRR